MKKDNQIIFDKKYQICWEKITVKYIYNFILKFIKVLVS